MPRTLQDLVLHMVRHKDALVILGRDSVKSISPSYDIQEYLLALNKKHLRRNKEIFWSYFIDKCFIDPLTTMSNTQSSILDLIKYGLVKNVVSISDDGLLEPCIPEDNFIQLHGNVSKFVCQRSTCLKANDHSVILPLTNNNPVPSCMYCGNQYLRPSMLLPGENYDQEKYLKTADLIDNTHTILSIGLDYKVHVINNLLGGYADIKAAAGDRIMTTIIDHSHDIDVNEVIGFQEYLIKDNCDNAMDRLIQFIQKNLNLLDLSPEQ